MLNVSILGASGYSGAQLVNLIHHHPKMALKRTLVSANSADAGCSLADLHGALAHLQQYELEPLSDSLLETLANTMDVIFLATPHQASHKWVEPLSAAGAKVIDLSGAFRLPDQAVFAAHYGFAHTADTGLAKAVYGLAEWHADAIRQAQIVAAPGCYPTAALTALKPLAAAGLLDASTRPVINAVSGVTGAGRKAALGSSFSEVSLQAYGVLNHRHTPEIETYLGTPVIFTPHLGNFKRGIVATSTVKLAAGVTAAQVAAAYEAAYAQQPLVRLRSQFPKADDVAHTPFVDVHWQVDAHSGYAVVGSALDNLLKGAAGQAVQCANLMHQWPGELGLLP